MNVGFKITTVQVVEAGKKNFLVYTITIRSWANGLCPRDDSRPVTIKRRYTDFLQLYNTLKKDFPNLMESVRFPNKVYFGNFSEDTVLERKIKFYEFLVHINGFSQLRNSDAVMHFFQYREISTAIRLIQAKQFEEASNLVEDCFWLINKLRTDRSPIVLMTLCLLVSLKNNCNDGDALSLAALAVKRFQGVSDIDLLRYYGPLLNISLDLCQKYGKDCTTLKHHLSQLKQHSISTYSSTPLFQLVLPDITTAYNINYV